MPELTPREILTRVHAVKRAALEDGVNVPILTILDDLADDIAFTPREILTRVRAALEDGVNVPTLTMLDDLADDIAYLTPREILTRVHAVKRAALEDGVNVPILTMLDNLADDIAFGVDNAPRLVHIPRTAGHYTHPRPCDHSDCTFVTDSRKAYWDHMVNEHGI